MHGALNEPVWLCFILFLLIMVLSCLVPLQLRSCSAFQLCQEDQFLPALLTTRQPCREIRSPAPFLEWPAKQEESGSPGKIRRMSRTGATAGYVSGWSSPRGQTLVKSSSVWIFVFIYKFK